MKADPVPVFAAHKVMLREHFRSVPAIIAYSNRTFYEDFIQPLRIARASERIEPPLVDIHVEGGLRALKDVNDGKIRIVARARDATELQNQTIRVNLANVDSLKNKRAAITKFMQVVHKSIDWAYTNPQAIEIFAQNMKVTRDIAQKAVDEYYPKAAMQIGEVKDLERSLQDALDYKFLTSPKTPKDITGLFDIVYKPTN